MILEHVPQGARLIVVPPSPAFDPLRLGHGDLHVIDMPTVEKRLKYRIPESKQEQILNGLLPEVVIDAVNLLFAENAIDALIELLSGREVRPKRLLDNDAPSVETCRRQPPGDVVEGVVKNLADFGAFIELIPGLEGLLHVSEIDFGRVANPGDVIKEGDEVVVKVVEIDQQQGRIRLSRKAVLYMDPEELPFQEPVPPTEPPAEFRAKLEEDAERRASRGGDRGGDRGGRGGPRGGDRGGDRGGRGGGSRRR